MATHRSDGTCLPCPDGQTSTVDKTACSSCPAGYGCGEEKSNIANVESTVSTGDSWDDNLNDMNSDKFTNAERKTCGALMNGSSSIQSCSVSDFAENGDDTRATVDLKIETGETNPNEVINQLENSFQQPDAPALENIRVSGIEPRQSPVQTSNIISKLNIGPTWFNELADRRSEAFYQKEAAVCQMLRNAQKTENRDIHRCSISKFEPAEDGIDIMATIDIDVETEEIESSVVEDNFESVVSAASQETPIQVEEITASRPVPTRSKRNISKVDTSVEVDKEFTSNLADVDSSDFRNAEASTCHRISQGSTDIRSCQVSSFSRDGDRTVADVQLGYATDGNTNSEILEELQSSYDTNSAPALAHPQVTKTDSIRPRENLANLSFESEIDEPYRSSLADSQSSQFKNYEAKSCNDIARSSPDIKSCFTTGFRPEGQKTIANMDVAYETDTSNRQDVITDFQNQVETNTGTNIRDARLNRIEPRSSRQNQAQLKTAVTVPENYEPGLADRNTENFRQLESSTCDSMTQGSHLITGCKVNNFSDANGNTSADVLLDYQTDKSSHEEITREFVNNFDDSGLSTPSQSEMPLSRPKVLNVDTVDPRQNTAQLDATVPVPKYVEDLFPSVPTDRTSQEFLDKSAAVCSEVLRSGPASSCRVEEFHDSHGETTADLVLDYNTNANTGNGALREFINNHDNSVAPLSGTRPVDIRPNTSKNQIVELDTTTVVDTPYNGDLADRNSQTFVDAEAITCAGIKRGGMIKSCIVDRFTQTNDETHADVRLEYETNETNPQDAYHNFVQNYDPGEVAELGSIRPVKVEPQRTKSNLAEIKASTGVSMPFEPALDDQSSEIFFNTAEETCATVKNGGNIESCEVESFSEIESETVADLTLKYPTNEVRQSRISDEFREQYDSTRGARLDQVRTVRIETSVVRENTAQINTNAIVNEPFTQELTEKNTDDFKSAEARTCSAIQRNGVVSSCKVESFKQIDGDTVAEVNLGYDTDRKIPSEVETEFAANFDGSNEISLSRPTRPAVIRSAQPKENISRIKSVTKLDETMTEELNDRESLDFIKKEGETCAAINGLVT